MKVKVSISMNEETIVKIEGALQEGRFRNKSHVFEYAVNKMLREGKNE